VWSGRLNAFVEKRLQVDDLIRSFERTATISGNGACSEGSTFAAAVAYSIEVRAHWKTQRGANE
jgi:hypothetical protein